MSTVHVHAEKNPDKPAVIFGNGEKTISYGELERSSARIAVLLRQAGLGPGDGVALLMANEDRFYDVYWACMRSGLYFTPVNWHLQADEARYVVDNCDAKAFLSSSRFAETAVAVASDTPKVQTRLAVDGSIDGHTSLEDALSAVPEAAQIESPLEGATMLYSSGTTGFPKGVRTPLSGRVPGDPAGAAVILGMSAMFGLSEDDRYLSPAPLYHAAPLAFSTAQHRLGSTTVAMRSFDAEDALATIQAQRCTTSQWVPTHFRRLLQLPDEVRARYDVSSMRVAIHAAAPCPIDTKRRMIEWWGPVIVEYYAGTEGGGTLIRSEDWLAHEGSVGRHWAGGQVHILDEDDHEVTEPRVEGRIFFDASPDPRARFKYYKDDEKTQGSYVGDRFTLGDVGYLDEDGFLYLTDRKSHMIISGGVNIYPQETENLLSTHEHVDDVAVIGVPNEEMGEEVKAVVIPRGADPSPELAQSLIDFCREKLTHYKCPRSIDFVDELPRTETGKLQKRKLRDRYWGEGRRI